MKKTLSLLISIAIVISLLLHYQQVEAIHSFKMDLFPKRINTSANYVFHFTSEEGLDPNDWIKMGFPQGTVMPLIPTERAERDRALKRIIESMILTYPNHLSFCCSLQGMPTLTFYDDGTLESIQFTLGSHAIDPDDEKDLEVSITVSEVLEIKTPQEAGFYEYSISTRKAPHPKTTFVEITESQIGIPFGFPKVKVDPLVVSYTAGYDIKFHVGLGGGLRKVYDTIDVRFPAGTRFTKPFDAMDPEDITINGIHLQRRPENMSDIHTKILRVRLPTNIPHAGEVNLSISPDMGIKTPPSARNHYWEVRTCFEDWAVSMDTYLMESRDYVALSATPNTINSISTYTVCFFPQLNIPEKSSIALYFPKHIQFEKELVKVYLDQTPVLFYFEDSLLIITSIAQCLTKGELYQLRVTNIRNPNEPQTLQVRLDLPMHIKR